jgi:hypothetical protein
MPEADRRVVDEAIKAIEASQAAANDSKRNVADAASEIARVAAEVSALTGSDSWNATVARRLVENSARAAELASTYAAAAVEAGKKIEADRYGALGVYAAKDAANKAAKQAAFARAAAGYAKRAGENARRTLDDARREASYVHWLLLIACAELVVILRLLLGESGAAGGLVPAAVGCVATALWLIPAWLLAGWGLLALAGLAGSLVLRLAPREAVTKEAAVVAACLSLLLVLWLASVVTGMPLLPEFSRYLLADGGAGQPVVSPSYAPPAAPAQYAPTYGLAPAPLYYASAPPAAPAYYPPLPYTPPPPIYTPPPPPAAPPPPRARSSALPPGEEVAAYEEALRYAKARYRYEVTNFAQDALVQRVLDYLLALLALYLVVRPLVAVWGRLMRDRARPRGRLATVAEVVAEMRRRASRLKLAAAGTMLLILFCMISGLVLFVYAGKVTSADINQIRSTYGDMAYRLSLSVADVERTEQRLTRTKERLKDFAKSYEDTLARAGVVWKELKAAEEKARPEVANAAALARQDGEASSARVSQRLYEDVRQLRDEVSNLQTGMDAIIAMDGRTTEAVDTLKAMSSKLDSLTQGMNKLSDNSGTNPLTDRSLYLTLSTRFGSIPLLLFLVQILVTMYRHNIRLAAHYDSRADALLIVVDALNLSAGVTVADWEKFVERLAIPENLDFGRPKVPKMPGPAADSTRDMFTEILSLLRQGLPGASPGR